MQFVDFDEIFRNSNNIQPCVGKIMITSASAAVSNVTLNIVKTFFNIMCIGIYVKRWKTKARFISIK